MPSDPFPSALAKTPQIRLLQCMDCMSVEELPPALPSEADRDPILRKVLAEHVGPLDSRKLSRRPPGAPRPREIRPDESHIGSLGNVDPTQWNDPEIRQQILRQMWGDHKGYPDSFYEARSTFTEDAGICYNDHGRPGDPDHGPHGCVDFESDAKRLTDPEWRSRGHQMGIERSHVYLCQWCPYQSVVTVRKRMARGDYDN